MNTRSPVLRSAHAQTDRPPPPCLEDRLGMWAMAVLPPLAIGCIFVFFNAGTAG
ncbi:hypothetical protein [Alteraurantiacibacter palmitatis]|uniref:Sugar ABC transporter permease n=1 Tax=Alteraurantiacibacter palmitatis TaxID=2054628 RepID=A0ABV7E481_9SPHN